MKDWISTQIMQIGEIEIWPLRALVFRCGKPVDLSMMEYRLLLIFFNRPDEYLSVDSLLRVIHGEFAELYNRTHIYVLITRLRKKLGNQVFCCKKRKGYKLRDGRIANA